MSKDLLSCLNPQDNLHEIEYGQHLNDAGFSRNKPTIDEVIGAMPYAEELPPIIKKEVEYRDVYMQGKASVSQILIPFVVLILIWVICLFIVCGLWLVLMKLCQLT